VIRVVVGILGAALIALNLAEFFVTFLLPRRVKRGPRLARGLYRLAWIPARAIAGRMSPRAGDALLGVLGPAWLLSTLALWTLGLVLGFAALQFAGGSHVLVHGTGSFLDDLYFSGGAFLSDSAAVAPTTPVAKLLMLWEAATGFAVLFIVIGYLPALYQAFSRREVVVSQLDPRAGSPPSAGALLMRSAERGGWGEIAAYLGEWDDWAAELMETHLSYPILAYYRSQHLNQNWLAAMTAVLDTSAFTMAAESGPAAHAAELTFAISRHCLSDLAFTFGADPAPPAIDRLPPEVFAELYRELSARELSMPDEDTVRARLDELRESYERYANALAGRLVLSLPSWMPTEESQHNWVEALWHTRSRATPLP
jgi:hypothetical protein